MRSRYTAYTAAKIAYIRDTQTGPAAENFDPKSVLRWAKSCKWLGLSVNLQESTVDFWNADVATVAFTAEFMQADVKRQMHERSRFKRIAGRWYYYSIA